MTAKTGAPSLLTPPVPGLRGSTAAPRQKHPSCPLQAAPRSAAFNRSQLSQQHLLSPPVPARCSGGKSATVPSGKTERRKANPPTNVWNRWVSGLCLPPLTPPPSSCCWSLSSHMSPSRTMTGCSKPTRHYVWSWGRRSGRWRCWRRCWRGRTSTLWRRTPLDRHLLHTLCPLEGWCCPLMAGFLNMDLL